MILLVLAITLVPMLYLILSGFRTTGQLGSNPNGLPHPWVWSNYATILTSAVFWQAVQNSAIVAVIATGLAVVLGSMAAFALSRYNFRGREPLFLLFVAGLLFPLNTAALPLFLMLQKIGLNDNMLGVALPEAAFSLPVTIFILRPFMRAIPGELEDAATVDGATRIRFFLRILLPLSRPALVTVGILAFVTSWNTYLLPLIVFSTPSHYTLPLAVAMFQSQYSTDTAKVFAYTGLSMIPALAIFVFAQRQLVGGLVGAVRG
ncbi:MAG TPA: carbohydrate ABC transporter permease [Streptosporangiaceae bacterium]|nr:carbohydrate ABC transporter permease [Streptosporangiaceae bacterium]